MSKADYAFLQTFLHTGKANASTFARAYALLKAADGWSDAQICDTFRISRNTSSTVRKRYLERGLEAVFYDKKQQRYRQALIGEQAAYLIAIACTPALGVFLR